MSVAVGVWGNGKERRWKRNRLWSCDSDSEKEGHSGLEIR